MVDVTGFIESGILEVYVLGHTNAEETAEVEKMAAQYAEVRKEIEEIGLALSRYANARAVTPDPMIEPFLMARIDYMERIKKGETPAFPPLIQMGSTIADYLQWLSRTDLGPTEPLTSVHASIIGYTPDVTTAIVWLKDGAPDETHTNELEKFLIVEGTCDIIMGKEVRKMNPGDVLIIPLHVTHSVRVTSSQPCKIILQRAAA
jgi:mannose-6-phosphate isomerase-like protein (cupin superfamily)